MVRMRMRMIWIWMERRRNDSLIEKVEGSERPFDLWREGEREFAVR